jgi:hypothetical protein
MYGVGLSFVGLNDCIAVVNGLYRTSNTGQIWKRLGTVRGNLQAEYRRGRYGKYRNGEQAAESDSATASFEAHWIHQYRKI